MSLLIFIWKNSVTAMESNKSYSYWYEKHYSFVIFIKKNSVITIIDMKSTKSYCYRYENITFMKIWEMLWYY